MAKNSSIANARYKIENYDRINLQLPRGSREALRAAAAAAGNASLNAWIASILERETGISLTMTGRPWQRKHAADSDEK